ncbi:MAG: choice-of-anchor Q domain-containing protein [Acidobacteriaceae bacterium]|nr:choice-of-anchor Q domain-containing protein [Acidobacteriaceae bacterium]
MESWDLSSMLGVFINKVLKGIMQRSMLQILKAIPFAAGMLIVLIVQGEKTLLAQTCGASQLLYVATTGSDSNPGTQSSPFLTISKGVALLNAGGTLYVMGGIYHETVAIYSSGTATSPISILAYPGQSPIIDGEGTLPTTINGALLELAGNYINVSGFEIRNTNTTLGTNAGVVVLGNHDRVSHLNVHHAYQAGILLSGDYGTIEYSTVWENAYNNCRLASCPTSPYPGGGWATGMSIEGKTANRTPIGGVMQNNVVYNNWGEGISTFQASGTVIQDNISYDNFATNFYISDASNVLAQRNLGYTTPNNAVGNSSNRCIQLADENAAFTPRSSNNAVINNMCWNSRFLPFSWTGVPNSGLVNDIIANNTVINSSFETGDATTLPNPVTNSNTVIANNIVVNTGTIAIVPSSTGLTFSNNLWSIAPPAVAMGTNSLVGDPLVVGAGSTSAGQLTTSYFKLSAGSPAANAGLNLTPTVTTDAFGQTRHATPTIGAYEFP